MLRRLGKPLLLVAVVLLLLVVIVRPKVSFHRAWDNNTTEAVTSFGSSTTSGELSTFSRFVIVAQEASGAEAAMQSKVAEELRVALAERVPVYRVDPSWSGWTSTGPDVFVCAKREEALKLAPDFMVFVNCEKWERSGLPFFKSYTAEVTINGGAPTYISKLLAISPIGSQSPHLKLASAWPQPSAQRFLDYNFASSLTSSGNMKGIFSSDYLTSKVAKSIAAKVTDEVAKYIKEQFDDCLGQHREQLDEEREPASAPG